MGASGASIADFLPDDGWSEGEEDAFLVWPENWPVLRVFLAARSQWRMHPMGGPIGLDYPGVEALMRMMDVKNAKEIFPGLQVMEAAALEAWSDERADA